MNKNGPIVVLEDDIDDQLILEEIFKTLNYENELIFFEDGNMALEFLAQNDVQPFLILSDINMPKMNGFEIRQKIFTNQQLQLKCIPYLFFTTGVNKKSVTDAYSMSVQGFFKKPDTIPALQKPSNELLNIGRSVSRPVSINSV